MCCGQLRHRRVECPDDCQFLIESRGLALKRLVRLNGDPEFELKWFEVLHNLRLALVRVKELTQPALGDDEALVALANIIESRRVRSKGLIYDFQSPNPNIQKAADALMKVIEHYENGRTGPEPEITPAELTGCLRYLHQQASTARDKGVRFLSLFGLCVGSRLIGLERAGAKGEQRSIIFPDKIIKQEG
ncbi:MAG: hypothetical protein ACUVUR_04620 [bacterium]